MKKKNNSKKEVAIKVRNLSKSFEIPHEKIDTVKGAFVGVFKRREHEKFKALDKVSFEVEKGEFFGIIGRNGSGKSTLLKILANIYTPDNGSVLVNGKISPFLELGIGFNPELSGRDNIYLNGTVLGLTKEQIDEKFDSIVEFSELKRFIDQKLKNYSSGMQVRLAFSVSIHANRDILLMDEVLAVGDTNFQNKCLEEFNGYRNSGKTVILVSHDISTIQRYCDRAMLLRRGRLEMIGEPEVVGSRYIYQNMSDEEKRILAEEKRKEKEDKKRRREEEKKKLKEKKRRKRRIVKIEGVEVLDFKNQKKKVFKTCDGMKVRILFKRFIEVKEVNIGLGLYSEDGSYLFSYNTQMDRHKIERKVNEVCLSFESMPLLKGRYYINIVCFGRYEQDFFDFKSKASVITFFSGGESNMYRGLINIKHNWI